MGITIIVLRVGSIDILGGVDHELQKAIYIVKLARYKFGNNRGFSRSSGCEFEVNSKLFTWVHHTIKKLLKLNYCPEK